MANTYTQLTCHVVFAVKHRNALLDESVRPRVFGFLSECLSVRQQRPLAVGGYYDHVHLLFGFTPDARLSDIIGQIKSDSSSWINEKKLCKNHFLWQAGFSAFTCSKAHRHQAIQYIMNQEAHHKGHSFREEYERMMIENGITFDQRFAFEFFDDVHR
jgi:putative transposase